jgi:hypothetical protein
MKKVIKNMFLVASILLTSNIYSVENNELQELSNGISEYNDSQEKVQIKYRKIDFKDGMYIIKMFLIKDNKSELFYPFMINELSFSDPKNIESFSLNIENLLINKENLKKYLEKTEPELKDEELEEVMDVLNILPTDNSIFIDSKFKINQSIKDKSYKFYNKTTVEKFLNLEVILNVSNISEEIKTDLDVTKIEQAKIDKLSIKINTISGFDSLKQYVLKNEKITIEQFNEELLKKANEIKVDKNISFENKKVLLNIVKAVIKNKNIELELSIVDLKMEELIKSSFLLMFNTIASLEIFKNSISIKSKILD